MSVEVLVNIKSHLVHRVAEGPGLVPACRRNLPNSQYEHAMSAPDEPSGRLCRLCFPRAR